jgi:hypothetical protein
MNLLGAMIGNLKAANDMDDESHDGLRRGSGINWVLIAFLAVVGFFLFTEHLAHLFGFLPFLLLFACILGDRNGLASVVFSLVGRPLLIQVSLHHRIPEPKAIIMQAILLTPMREIAKLRWRPSPARNQQLPIRHGAA